MNPTNNWATGFCDCFSDFQICLLGCICPSILYGLNTQKITNGGCFGPCILYWYCGLFAPIFAGSTRRLLRTKYNLPSEPCNDNVAHLWFVCCTGFALCQEARELKYRASIEQTTSSEQQAQPAQTQPLL